jgi:hypothetical protein
MVRDIVSSNRRRASLAATLVALASGALPSAARSDDPPQCPSSTDDAYTMTAGALTGPTSTDLALHIAAAPGCGAVAAAKHVQLKIFSADGKVDDVINLRDIAAADGVVAVELDRVERGRQIEVQAQVESETSPRTYVVRGSTTSLLRPDLVVGAVQAPLQTVTTRPVDVTAEIAEVNGDTGATATVTLTGPGGPLAEPIEVTVPAGGTVSVTFPGIPLTIPLPVELNVATADAAPGEYDTTNNTQSRTVEVTKSELAASRLLLDNLAGAGFQFNHHLYAPITIAPPETLPTLEAKVKALEPQLARVFYSEIWEGNSRGDHPEWPQNLESFRRVVELADEAGATVVIAYQSFGQARLAPELWMGRFADVLEDLVRNRGLTNVRWVSIGNEPNGGAAITLPQYEAMYRALDAELRARGLSDQIGLVGGDLVQGREGMPGGHRTWFDYMVANMNDVVDAWSEHIYWSYFDTFRMEERLKDVSHLVHQELPEEARKPTFLLEFGVRGVTSCGTKPDLRFAYYQDEACTDMRRMPLSAFQRLWFTINAAQLGLDGSSSWDLYWATYDRSNPPNQSFWAIGPPGEDWALYPPYYAFQLLFQTTARGWQVLGVDPWGDDDAATRFDNPRPDQPEQELVAYIGPGGLMTIAGLDTNGGQLTAPDGTSSTYSIGGLPANTTFTLALWNANGDGTNSVAGTIFTDAAGVARFDVPTQAAFVLTTVPVA